MSICFFTARCSDGAGDIVQTVKIAKFIQSKFYQDNIIIVVPNRGDPPGRIFDHKAITVSILSDIAPNTPNIQVLWVSEFVEKRPKIDCCILAGLVRPILHTYYWQVPPLSELLDESIPWIYMPEYGDLTWDQKPLEIRGGFFESAGVIPHQKLLDVSASGVIPKTILEEAFKDLDPGLKYYLGNDFESYSRYRATHGLTYQYCHNTQEYPQICYRGDNGRNVYDEQRTYRPVDFFLQEHIIYLGDNSQSQDVICIGEDGNTNESYKKLALERLTAVLKEKGYSKVIFVNMKTQQEEIIYSVENQASDKVYRVFHLEKTPFPSMQAIVTLSDDFVGATGDNSLVEAMSAGKLISYECGLHKKNFISGYLKAVEQKASHIEVNLLAELMMKVKDGRSLKYDIKMLKRVLSNKAVVDELKRINRTLVAESKYFDTLQNILENIVFKKPAPVVAVDPLLADDTSEADVNEGSPESTRPGP